MRLYHFLDNTILVIRNHNEEKKQALITILNKSGSTDHHLYNIDIDSLLDDLEVDHGSLISTQFLGEISNDVDHWSQDV